jgi:putative phosphoesterase
MLRIAVIADTHDKLPGYVVDALCRADEVWHLGDVCDPSTLDPLLELECRIEVVQGNCDGWNGWPTTQRLVREGRVFHLEHIPPMRPPAGVDIVLHGHTHVPRDEIVLGVRYLNPGCITRPNRGAPASMAWLTLPGDGTLEWQVVRLVELA